MVCGSGPGSFGNYDRDAARLAEMGCDFLKVDYCAYDQSDPKRFRPPIQDQLPAWQALRDALNRTGRPIYSYFCPRSFGGTLTPPAGCGSACCLGKRCVVDGPPKEWSGPTRAALANTILTEYGNSHDSWTSAMSNLDAVLALRPQPDVEGGGFWSDADMLQSCNFGKGKTNKPPGMAQPEYEAQFATWAVLASQLVISADLRSLAQDHPACLAMLKNAEVLAVNQDPAGYAPRVVFERNTTVPYKNTTRVVVTAQGFARRLQGGAVALLLLNRDTAAAELGISWAEIGLPAGAACAVRDLLGQADLPGRAGNFTAKVAPRTARLVRVSCGARGAADR